MQTNFNNYKSKLTESDIAELTSIIGDRCSVKTKRRIEANLKYSSSAIPEYGILNRLIKEGYWNYYAGQSYPDEIRTVRKIILELE